MGALAREAVGSRAWEVLASVPEEETYHPPEVIGPAPGGDLPTWDPESEELRGEGDLPGAAGPGSLRPDSPTVFPFDVSPDSPGGGSTREEPMRSGPARAASSGEGGSSGVPGDLTGLDAAPDGRARPFILRRLFAQGGMGEVWEAVQTTLQRVVAVKRIRRRIYLTGKTELVRSAEGLFHREALVTGYLDHPTVVPVYELGVDDDGHPLMAMKMVRGRSWIDMIFEDRTRLHPADFLARHIGILAEVTQAVAFAHRRGIIHRDLKPGQVMVGSRGEAFLMDWGLAVVVVHRTSATEMTGPMPTVADATNPAGTPSFMAPEQTDRSPNRLGTWTDVYLLGGILYYLMTGRAPHEVGDSQTCARHAHVGHVDPPELVARNSALIPADLRELVMAALAKDIAARPTIPEFLEALRDHLSGRDQMRQSSELLTQAETLLEAGGRSGADYDLWVRAEQVLGRAVALWPGNTAARDLRQRVLGECAEAALQLGDLGLAWAQALRLDQEKERGHLLLRIEGERARRRLRSLQRRIAIATSLVLMVVVGGLAAWYQVAVANARVATEEAQRRISNARAEEALSRAATAESERLAAQAQAVATLATEETQLAERLMGFWKSEIHDPPRLQATAYDRNVLLRIPEAERSAYESQYDELRRERDRLVRAGVSLPPPPGDLLFAKASHVLAGSAVAGTTDTEVAGKLFAELAEQGGRHRPRALVGQAVAAFRGGDGDRATALLYETAALIRPAQGVRRGVQRLMTLALESQRVRFGELALDPEDILIQSRSGGIRASQYSESAGRWSSSNIPVEWAQSMATIGLTTSPIGGRKLAVGHRRMVEGGLPARARFALNLAAPRRLHVYITWPLAANGGPLDAVIRHGGGSERRRLYQDGWGAGGPSNANTWVDLGAYDFSSGAGQGVDVEITTGVTSLEDTVDGQIMTDAVLFRSRPLERLVARAEWKGRASDGERPSVQWFPRYQDAVDGARGRRLFVFLEDSINPFKLRADREVFPDERVARMLNQHFASVRVIPYGPEPDNRRFRGNPSGNALILELDGRVVRRISGSDLLSPERLVRVLEESKP